MTDIFPPIESYATDFLKVSETQTMFAEQAGNPKTEPAAYRHGGSDVGNSPATRQFCDPTIYHISHFDIPRTEVL